MEHDNDVQVSKRLKMTPSRHVLLSCFDDERFVEVDVSLLEAFDCRLAALIRNQQNCTDTEGLEYWRSGMSRNMLITLVKSLTLGEIVLHGGVTIGEAISTFEYEGITIKNPGVSPQLKTARCGVGFQKGQVCVSDAVKGICTLVADSIVQWPRLETILDSTIGRTNVHVMGITATPSRIWVRFAERPMTTSCSGTIAESTQQLILKNLRWVDEGLVAIGILHHMTFGHDSELSARRDKKMFQNLCSIVEDHALGYFFHVRTDYVRMACGSSIRADVRRGEQFRNEIKSAVLQPLDNGEVEHSLHVQYARAVVTLLENMMHSAPSCFRVFSAHCMDNNGTTPERNTLEYVLRQRGVEPIRWLDERDSNVRPLVFPPHWKHNLHQANGPCLLLSFESLR
tara:strand:- start:2628 stop:3821 length:1194 start_codon:yes stop_codon:yes gene_type:complete